MVATTFRKTMRAKISNVIRYSLRQLFAKAAIACLACRLIAVRRGAIIFVLAIGELRKIVYVVIAAPVFDVAAEFVQLYRQCF
jgi:hypothetical protein